MLEIIYLFIYLFKCSVEAYHVVELLLAGLVCVVVVHLECWRGVDRLSRLGPLQEREA